MKKKPKQNLQKRQFPAYFRHFRPEKNFSQKSDSVIVNTHLCAKNQKKLMIKSRENAKKPVFPAYFQHFRPKNIFFQKSGSVTFWTLSFYVSVQNLMKKYQVQLEIFKKYCFSGENWLFRRFLDSSGFKISFFDNWNMLDGGYRY